MPVLHPITLPDPVETPPLPLQRRSTRANREAARVLEAILTNGPYRSPLPRYHLLNSLLGDPPSLESSVDAEELSESNEMLATPEIEESEPEPEQTSGPSTEAASKDPESGSGAWNEISTLGESNCVEAPAMPEKEWTGGRKLGKVTGNGRVLFDVLSWAVAKKQHDIKMGIEATAGFSRAENAMAAYHHLCWWIFCFGFAKHMITFIPILLADARSVDTLV